MTAESYAAAAGLVARSAAAYVSGVPEDPADEGLFGAGSVTWRMSTDPGQPVAGLRALMVQALHPLAMAGVDQHSDWRQDPVGRLAATSAYLTTIKTSNPTLAQKLSAQWQALKQSGAQDAAITLFAADPAACSAELAATGTARSAASVVVIFGEEGQADRAWRAGILGFAPPAPGESPPGVTRGKDTGLGESAWTYHSTPVSLASWRKSVFVALVVVSILDGTAFSAATAAVDARLN